MPAAYGAQKAFFSWFNFSAGLGPVEYDARSWD